MSDDNRTNLPEEGTEPEVRNDSNNPGFGDDWTWDAAVPETDTTHISIEDLSFSDVTSFSAVNQQSSEEKSGTDDSNENTETEESSEPVSSAEEPDDGLCIVCGKPRKKSVSDLYCESCREKYLRTSYSAGHVILTVVIMLVAVIGYFVCFTTVGCCSKLAEAESLCERKLYSSAINKYGELLDDTQAVNDGINSVFRSFNKNFAEKEWFSSGGRSADVMLKSYSKTVSINGSDHENFIRAFDSFLPDSKAKKNKYSDIKAVYDFCSSLVDSSKKYMESWQKFMNGGTGSSEFSVDYDGAMKYLNSIKPENTADDCVISYYRFLTAFYSEKDPEESLGYFNDAYEAAGQFGYIFLPTYIEAAWQTEKYDKVITLSKLALEDNPDNPSACYNITRALIFSQKLDEASEYCEKLKKYNPDSLDYYSIKAELLRRNGSFEEAVKICEEGIKAGTDAEIYRQQAIAYLLMDKKENALNAMQESYNITIQSAYSNSNVPSEILNTAALVFFLCGDNDKYNEITDIFESQNMKFEKAVTDCIKGEITLEDIFMNGTGDI